MAKYRKKSFVGVCRHIEAFQMTKERWQDNSKWPNWLNKAWNTNIREGAVWSKDFPNPDGTDERAIGILKGVYIISFNDYIIKGINDELYVCKPNIFEQTYEQIE